MNIYNNRIISTNYDNESIDVQYLIIHYTAGSWKRVKSIFEGNQPDVSAHFVIDTNGDIDEVVPCFDGMTYKARHAGKSKDSNGNEISYYNSYSIGIELVNYNGNIIRYTSEQYKSLIWITKNLLLKYPNISGPHKILGHEQIAGYRGKSDPGRLFEWGQYIGSVFPNLPDINRDCVCPYDLQTSLRKFLDFVPKDEESSQRFWHAISHITETSVRLIRSS